MILIALHIISTYFPVLCIETAAFGKEEDLERVGGGGGQVDSRSQSLLVHPPVLDYADLARHLVHPS